MKKTRILYWVFTGLFAAFMAFTAIPDIMMMKDAVTFMTEHLGYPAYFLPFIGVAKVLGSVAILVPGFPRIKEWAYAGLVFDLVGAVYSVMITDGFNPGLIFLSVPLILFVLSYTYCHKLEKAKAQSN